MVSPDCNEGVVSVAADLDLPCAAGALTPTEVGRAFASGASVVKVFPMSAVGGISYIEDLKGPFPDIAFIVSGGIGVAHVRDYLDVGVHADCLGGALVNRNAISKRNVDLLADHIHKVMREIGP